MKSAWLSVVTPCTKIFMSYNTPAAKAMGLSVDVLLDLKLGKTDKVPKGTVVFSFTLTTPIDKEVGSIMIAIDGAKTKVTSKIK